MSDDSDDPLSNSNLRKVFKQSTTNITDDQLKALLRRSLTDEVVKKSLMAQIPDLIKTAEQSGKSKEELQKYQDQLTAWFSKPETIAKTREDIVNDLQTLSRIRAALADPTDDNIREMRDAVSQSLRFRAANAVLDGCKKGYLDAAFWGVTSGAQLSVEVVGSTSRMAKFLALGRSTPLVAIGVSIVEGAFAYKDFKNGHYEEGSKAIGGSVGGLTATLAAGQVAIDGVLAVPPVAVAAAVGVMGYYAGRGMGKIGYDIYQTASIRREFDAAYQPDKEHYRNFRNAALEMLNSEAGSNPQARAQLAALGIPSDNKGHISLAALDAAMTDPIAGGAVTEKVKSLLRGQNARFEKTMKDNDTWRPWWLDLTDGALASRQKYDLAKMGAREMDSALQEIDGYRTAVTQQRSQANADLANAAAPFNKLLPGVQAGMVASLEKNYTSYKQQNGDKAMDHNLYMLAGKASIVAKPEMVKIFQDAEGAIQCVAGKQLAEWKAANLSADTKQTDARNQTLLASLRNESLNDPQAFKTTFAHYRQMDAARAEVRTETTPMTNLVAKSGIGFSPTTASPAFRSSAGQTPSPVETAPSYLVNQFSDGVQNNNTVPQNGPAAPVASPKRPPGMAGA